MAIDRIINYSEEIKRIEVPRSEREGYGKVKDILAKGQRLAIIKGLRGSGKTTILKNIHIEGKSVYCAGDFLRLEKLGIKDIVQASEYLGAKIILIDEIQYIDWKLEMKVIHDMKPDKTFIISGSSALLLSEMSGDLKRRAEVIKVGPLSFREYLRIHGLDIDKREDLFRAIFNEKPENAFYKLVALNAKIGDYRKFYGDFLNNPLPALFTRSDKKEALREITNAVVDEDIPRLDNIETEILQHAKDVLYYLATADKISINSMSQKLGISKFSVSKLVELLEKAELIYAISPVKGNEVLKGRKKYTFACQLMRQAISFAGETQTGFGREDLFVKIMKNRGLEVNYSYTQEDRYDYIVNGKRFEIGGASKKGKEGIVIVERGELMYKDGALYLPLELLALME